MEVHPKLEKAFNDGAQSLTFKHFRAMMDSLQPYLELRSQAQAVKA